MEERDDDRLEERRRQARDVDRDLDEEERGDVEQRAAEGDSSGAERSGLEHAGTATRLDRDRDLEDGERDRDLEERNRDWALEDRDLDERDRDRDLEDRDEVGADGPARVETERDAEPVPARAAAAAAPDRETGETEDEPAPARPAAASAPHPEGQPFDPLAQQDTDGFHQRWEVLQASFVDDPKASTKQADRLVGEVLERLRSHYDRLHTDVRDQLDRDDTEAMRITLQRYRALFRSLVR